MFSTLYLSVNLPTPTSEEIEFYQNHELRSIEKLSAPISLPLERVSPRFLEYNDPHQFDKMASLFGIQKEDNADENGANNSGRQSDDDEDEEEVEAYLATLDPRSWKSQDHYMVLGLQNLRYKATQDDIKKAYLKMALKHHPDKKASQKIEKKQTHRLQKKSNTSSHDRENIFKCIQKANDILSDPMKRQEFDSVDSAVDESPNSVKEMLNWVQSNTWYSNVIAILEREKRFAMNPESIPSLGTEQSTKPEVDAFYDAWYHFESWRRFNYLDKDEVEGENRDDKRYQDKKNKAERMKKLTQEKARLRTIIEQIEQTDPRMKKLIEEEKEAKKLLKLAKRQKLQTMNNNTNASETSAVANASEETNPKESSQSSDARENEEKQKKDAARKKNADMKKEKKFLKTWITKTARYLTPENEELKSAVMEKVLMDLDMLLDKKCTDLPILQGLKKALLNALDQGGIENVRRQFNAYVSGTEHIPSIIAITSADTL